MKHNNNRTPEERNTLKKEIEEDTRRREDFLHSWIGSINITKMTIPQKVIYRFTVIPIKTPMLFFHTQKFKFMWKQKIMCSQKIPY